jgi:hypothetical protein
MYPIKFEFDLLGNLRQAVSQAGLRKPVLFVDATLTDPTALADLVLREQRGYRETELDVAAGTRLR